MVVHAKLHPNGQTGGCPAPQTCSSTLTGISESVFNLSFEESAVGEYILTAQKKVPG